VPSHFAIRRFVLTEEAWSAVIAPMDCGRVVLENEGSAAVLLRSDATDSDTEKRIGSTMEVEINSRLMCFELNAPICYARSATGPGRLVAMFTR
jgi:hypothetical protein